MNNNGLYIYHATFSQFESHVTVPLSLSLADISNGAAGPPVNLIENAKHLPRYLCTKISPRYNILRVDLLNVAIFE
jgi:hypothetical protein